MSTNKNDLFAQYQIVEELGEQPQYSLFKVKAPGGGFKMWKKIDLGFSASVETRLLPILEKLQHPYLNSISNSFHFPDKSLLFIESDYPHKTLRSRLDECKSAYSAGQAATAGLPPGEALAYAGHASEAIDYLNSPQHTFQGKKIAIYHRALCPECLQLFEDRGKQVCKVGDFGLAKPVADSQEAARHSLGLTNYEYAPPEFDEGLTTGTSDQYSLATIYYELRTGKLPFSGSLLQRLQAQLNGTPDLRGVDGAERNVIARALSKDPSERFGTCREFVGQLQAALKGVNVAAPAVAPAPAQSAASASANRAGFGGASGNNTGGSVRSGVFSTSNSSRATSQPAASSRPTPMPPSPPVAAAKAPNRLTETMIEDTKSKETPPPAMPELGSPNWAEQGPPSINVARTSLPSANDSMSDKGRQVLELIKNKRPGGISTTGPASGGFDKQLSGGSRVLNAAPGTGGGGAVPGGLGMGSRVLRPNAPQQRAGVLGNMNAGGPPQQGGTGSHRPIPASAQPLPRRTPQPMQPAPMQPPSGSRRLNAAGSNQRPRTASRPPVMAAQPAPPSSQLQGAGSGSSTISLVLLMVAAFCIGMVVLYYFGRTGQ